MRADAAPLNAVKASDYIAKTVSRVADSISGVEPPRDALRKILGNLSLYGEGHATLAPYSRDLVSLPRPGLPPVQIITMEKSFA